MAHLVWDWNGTLLDDLALVVAATNAALASVGGPSVTTDEHRRDFRRPVSSYYAQVLGRPVDHDEFVVLDKVFHDTYRALLPDCKLATGAVEAIAAWPGTQSLVSMYFHHELVPVVTSHGLYERLARVDGLRASTGGGPKEPHLRTHLYALSVPANTCVLIGDSLDDAEAAAAVGARIVLYNGGITDEIRLRATGLPVANSLLEAIEYALVA